MGAEKRIIMKDHGIWITVVILAGLVIALGKNPNPHGHHGGPTPTPSPTVTPPPTPTPTPAPTPSATPTPIISVTLGWDAVADPTVEGYHLWSGRSPGSENMLAAVVLAGSALTATVPVLTGTTYFVVTAYNAGGESSPSNEVSYTAP